MLTNLFSTLKDSHLLFELSVIYCRTKNFFVKEYPIVVTFKLGSCRNLTIAIIGKVAFISCFHVVYLNYYLWVRDARCISRPVTRFCFHIPDKPIRARHNILDAVRTYYIGRAIIVVRIFSVFETGHHTAVVSY